MTLFGGKAALAVAIALGSASPCFAQPPARDGEPSLTARMMATNLALMDALLQRRKEVVLSGKTTDEARHALSFLESRIAQLNDRMAAVKDGRVE